MDNSELIKRLCTHPKPIVDLYLGIVRAACNTAKEIEETLGLNQGMDSFLSRMQLLVEAFAFFLHMSNRITHRLYGDDAVFKIQNEIYPLVLDLLIEGNMGHWPDEIKSRMRGEFIDNLNNAEIEYSGCREFLDEHDLLAQSATCTRFGANIVELTHELDRGRAVELAAKTAAQNFFNLEIEPLILGAVEALES